MRESCTYGSVRGARGNSRPYRDRREFIALLGGGVVFWPLRVGAQQPAVPVIGYLSSGSPDVYPPVVSAFLEGLKGAGYVEGQNVAVEYRWAQGQYDRLPALATDLVRQQVNVIVAGALPTVLAAKAATSNIPIVFTSGGDPVDLGLVASLSRPGGNVTGVSLFSVALTAKRLELLLELVPTASVVALLENPTNPRTKFDIVELQEAARAAGKQTLVVRADSEDALEAAFTTLAQGGARVLLVSGEPFFLVRREQIFALAVRHAVAAIYEYREFAKDGGLMSYGISLADMYRQVGVYVGQILKGAKPADLPVQQPTKLALVINLKTAKALGITVPPSLLARADEVIE